MQALAQWLGSTQLSHGIQRAIWLIALLQAIHILAIAMVLSSVAMIELRILGVTRSQTMTDTARRFTLKIVLRGVDRGTETQTVLEGLVFYFTGEATSDAWPDAKLQRGDLEAIAWTTKLKASEVGKKLEARADVVAVAVV